MCGKRRAVRVEHPVEEMFMLSILYMDRSMEDTELFMLKALGGFLKIRSYSRWTPWVGYWRHWTVHVKHPVGVINDTDLFTLNALKEIWKTPSCSCLTPLERYGRRRAVHVERPERIWKTPICSRWILWERYGRHWAVNVEYPARGMENIELFTMNALGLTWQTAPICWRAVYVEHSSWDGLGGGMEDIELVTSNALHMEMAWEIQ